MKIYLTVNAPALEAMILEVLTQGRAPSHSAAVALLLDELLTLRRERDERWRLLQEAVGRIGGAPAPPPPPPDEGEERLSW